MKRGAHVSLHVAPEHKRVVACTLVPPGLGKARRHAPDRPAPPGTWLALRDADHRKRTGKDAVALAVTGALVLRRAVAESALGPLLASGDARLAPVSLLANPQDEPVSKPRVLSDDWVLVETDRRHPIDRDGLDPKLLAPAGGVDRGLVYDPSRPFASLVARLADVPAWSAGTAPRAPLFRPLELPGEIFAAADAPFVAELRAALGKGVLDGELSDARIGLLEDSYGAPPFPGTAESARAAGLGAFRRIRGGDHEEDRALALSHPLWAFALARCAEGPRDDTRAAACAHPVTALLYARDVDRRPRDDTREAACAHPGAAAAYMRDVDHAEHPRTVAAIADHLSARDILLETRALAEIWSRAAEPDTTAGGPRAAASGGAAAEGATAGGPRAAGGAAAGGPRAAASGGEAAGGPRAAEGAAAPDDAEPWVGVEANVDAAPMASISRGPDLPLGAPLPADLPAGMGLTLSGAKTAKETARRVEKARVLSLSYHLAVRLSAIEALRDPLEKGGVRIRPLPVISAKGEVVDGDWALLEPASELPIDRDSSAAAYAHPGDPCGSWPLRIDAVRFGPGRAPGVGVFRVADAPSLVAWRASLARALKKALGKGVAVLESLSGLPCTPRVPSAAKGPPHTPDPAVAAGAMRAFFRLASGDTSAEARAAACASPFYALQVARARDRGPADDTRAGALADPCTAAEYASFVDRGPRADTRLAAAKRSGAAQYYARFVDRALTPPIVAALHAEGWTDEDLDTLKLPRRDAG